MNLALRPAELPTTTQAAEGLMRRRWSVAEIEEMVRLGIIAEEERFELFGGEVVPMSPKGLKHERMKQALAKHWFRRLPEGIELITETTFRLDKDTFLEPDFVFFHAATGLAGLTGETALLAVEVADSSLAYDLTRKARLYAAHGLRELWVIEAESRTAYILRRPGVEGYAERLTILPHEELVPAFAPACAVALGSLTLV
jgi:Uma2 family endonuclease